MPRPRFWLCRSTRDDVSVIQHVRLSLCEAVDIWIKKAGSGLISKDSREDFCAWTDITPSLQLATCVQECVFVFREGLFYRDSIFCRDVSCVLDLDIKVSPIRQSFKFTTRDIVKRTHCCIHDLSRTGMYHKLQIVGSCCQCNE